MIDSAVTLFRERGVHGTSFSDVLEHSGAPRGSLYHWFPGGKAQLAEEATRHAGEVIAAGLAAALDEKDPAAAVRGFARLYRGLLRRTDFAAGCPVVSATLEGDRSPGARDAAGAAFASWLDLLGSALERRGLEPERAQSIATLAIAAIEGGIVLARAERSLEPLERVAGEIETLVTAAVA
ncbi:MAG TPA: TetR/AcrR family transcriptional regulator [Thermoleophilaceae bacterium]|nr:TetR/AcrR family transcriptional regulator [Thermoleophilaceae bacterium]